MQASLSSPPRIALRRLFWLTVVAPAVFNIVLHAGSFLPHQGGVLSHAAEHTAVATIIMVAIFPFSWFVFRVFSTIQSRIEEQNTELRRVNDQLSSRTAQLRALNDASTAISTDLQLVPVLQQVVNASRALVGARYGAIRVDGVNPATSTVVSEPPLGGSRADALAGTELRHLPRSLAHLNEDGDVSQRNTLAIPITWSGRSIGSLHLAEKLGAPAFTEQDEEILRMLAVQAAIAIENARLLEEAEEAARLRERERIAMDIHDGILQSLYAVGLEVQSVGNLVGPGEKHAGEALQSAVQDLNGAIREIRQYLADLRADSQQVLRQGEDEGVDLLQQLADRLSQRTGVLCICGPCDAALLTADQRVQVAFVLREAFANIERHAAATTVWTALRAVDGRARLLVKDDGRGFDPASVRGSPGNGLKNMRERAHLLGGRLVVRSLPDEGTTLSLSFPLQTKAGVV